MTEKHKFVAPQISLAGRGGVLRSPDGVSTGAFFPSLFPHFLHSDESIHTFLLNPCSLEARTLSSHQEPVFFNVSSLIQERLEAVSFSSSETTLLTDALKEILSGLLPDHEEPPLDARIAECIRYVESLKAKRVAAGELAKRVDLSVSRFLCLFKREMKVTLRGYLMWRRAVEGGILVAKGVSVTEAAHDAGFTDSAHFSRVFKKLFGLTLSSALQDPMPILVIGDDVDDLERGDKLHYR
jgi:AraC-like DNA-binding protein